MYLLKCEGISKSFKSLHVLDDINLTVNPGDCLYIHGKNGCGKSTLFKIICDILQADQGQIVKSEDLSIGALIENPGFIEEESLHYNLAFLADLKNHYDEQRIRELCALFQLDYDNRSPMKSYSVGMRQKAGIIQAVMENQNCILFDEPTRGLDKEAIEQFEHLINDLIEKGCCVIIASHDYLPNVHYTKTYLLESGKLMAE
ncbi:MULTISPECIES: ATP-binding cassette domain-containing protein [Sharpea]|jgi:ABC-2 type transport system ATP-binding protein|uniref:ABC transporter ATP-binding protein n=1 Tax=Sharpea porci TaxID=2652286 RepID=A0A844FR54_9FIRM|nr:MULTISPECIES: ABC transporter ATP-binding protein [Sharpea]MDD6513606.1 ABC transporter ATP-binding protein [Sharpea azabuensis]MDD6711994.1 ABC transporter ATP-binding protein [Sharpea porci]MST88397.1 ABC transporter ATP-binding protein [Sharpea porci]